MASDKKAIMLQKSSNTFNEETSMTTENRTSIPGIVQNGVVVPQVETTLSEGAHVEIVLEPSAMSSELLSEIAAWDKASDEAWSKIDEWENERP